MLPVIQRPLKVLLVESEPGYLETLQEAVARVPGARLDVESAGELTEALERLSQGGIDVVLLELDLPDSGGVVTFERMNAFAPHVPIVVLTDEDDDAVAVSTVQGGAQDFLVKDDVQPAVLVRALRYAVERHRLLSALRSLSLIDDLTGLYNRRGFIDLGEQYLKLARRSGRGVTLIFLDFDRFKTINDTLGHHVGDRALLKMTDLLKATFRRSDILSRMGGDEFAVLAVDATGEDADTLVERLRDRIADFNQASREPYQLSVSIGMARYESHAALGLEELLDRADAAMYAEKRGRRRTALR